MIAGSASAGQAKGQAALPIVLCLPIAALAIGHASVQPLWEDETYGLVFAQRSLGSLLQALAASEPHLPPYFLFLRAWEALAGPSAFAERWPSAACFILTGVVVYRLGRMLLGPSAGLLALALWTIQPEGFWYGQEARMYAPLILWSALAALLFLRAARRQRRRDWLSFAAAELAALWTHYAGAFVPLFAFVWVFLVVSPEKRRRAAWWVIAPTLTYLPWLWYVRHIRPPTAQPAGSLADQTLTVGRGLLLGYGGPLLPTWLALGLLTALGGVCVAAFLSRRPALQVAAAPVVVIVALPGVFPPLHFLFNPRYLCLACPAIALLWAVVTVALARWRRLAGLALAAAVASASAAGMAEVLAPGFHHWYAYPAAMAYIRNNEQAGQLVVNNSGVDPTAQYYYQQVDGGTLPVTLLPPFHPGSVPDLEQTALGLSQRYTGVWLVPDAAGSWDGDRTVERALAATLLPAGRRQFNDVTVDFFSTARGLADQHAAATTFGDAIALEGYGIAREGDQWIVALHWQDRAPLGRDYTVFVQALDESGKLVAQGDGPPDGGRQPTSLWAAGRNVYDLHRVPAVGGSLHLIVGWYDPTTGTRLPTSGGADFAALGPLASTTPPGHQ